uniref:CCHC-type domain-containing protein n=1 Tax=Haemonchus contortus TaxID=6289 RepID=A0A7I5ED04_HAECO
MNPSTLGDSDLVLKVESSVFQLRAAAKQVEDALSAFTALVDSLEGPLSEEQEIQTQEYVEKTHEALDSALALAIRLEGNLIAARSCTQLDNHGSNGEAPAPELLEMTRPKLPTVPVPTFSGKLVEFENFWALFDANIHSQPLSPLLKFNYLIKALRGEAQECVRRFTVTADNYARAVQFLRAKYGDETKLLDHLQLRLERAQAESPTLEGQRSLLEHIWPTVTQLEERGVSLNGSFITRKVLSKFQPEIQRKVLEHRLKSSTTERTWIMQDLLKDLDKVIETEEQIRYMMRRTNNSNRTGIKGGGAENGTKHAQKGNTFCIFCASSDHKSLLCTKYASPEDRKRVFLDQGRCLNCGTPGHFTKACTKEGCRLCDGKKHHHTLCPAKMKSSYMPQMRPEYRKKEFNTIPTETDAQKRNSHSGTGRPQFKKSATAQAHTVDAEEGAYTWNETLKSDHSDNLTALLSTVRNQGIPPGNETVSPKGSSKVLLLTGVAKVKDPLKNQWKNVELLLDTGADESFITTELADELGLVCKAQKQLKVYTFGTHQPTETTCGVTALELWDAEGVRHTLQLHTSPILMATSKIADLSAEDLEFIMQRKISLSKPEWRSASKPQILVGCDQLWTFLNVSQPYYKLPSGLQLVPSKLGYLLTGRQDAQGLRKQEMATETTPTWINSLVNFDEQLDRWDKYWTLDSAGICEFTGTKNAEKEATNAKVAAFFEETIQKRSDGYYVRFPYKENHPPLPTNRAIALKRLQSVIRSLKNTPNLLDAYDKTFVEQKEMGIIEEVKDAPCTDNNIIHYIPHQPVITPHKETTKLRIVFDASAHFKNNPSLNDVLHQGPLILPEVYAILLRFRIPKYVVISDVEKAFLQIHLQETDRDATRFLWVKDLNAPIDKDNIVTLRFTRVTFGLNVSPYLLAGTIQHHLKHEIDDRDLSNEIRQNLYVDNLILSADTQEESRRKSLRAREIFKDMGMNLREFLSNDASLSDNLPQGSYTKCPIHKVLGIKWNSENDCLSISCSASSSHTLTKREVMRQIASIYDPLGWLVPLLMPAKKFQQDLWKQRYTWDATLPSPVVAQWNAIVEDINGFQKCFPRRFTDHSAPLSLAVFADASESAIATCAYLFNDVSSTLAMAKGKLPSIKATTTMPKLEMNALTLAVRLAFSITQAMKGCIPSHPWTVYVFSDSQIALSWLSPSKRSSLGVLVTNRLREIRRIVQSLKNEGVVVKFAYVNTSENPADAGTRGLSRLQLDNHIWWRGPSFLIKPEKYWYNTFYHLTMDENISEEDPCDGVCEVNAVGNQASSITELLSWERFNSITAAKRVTAVVLRFIKRCIRHLSYDVRRRILTNIPELEAVADNADPLNGVETLKGRLALIRNHQLLHLSHHYRKSMENTLRLYKDDNLLWRSRGRLGNAMLKDEAKSPLFIAPNTPLARLIIQEAHGNLHRGIEHTISKVRELYWVPKLRQQVRKVVSACVKCRRFNALPYRYPEMTDLPHQRVVKCRPFQNTGLDFFDLPSCREDGKVIKLYGCIFTCTVTRLIHIEVVRSMATEEFINALRRFIARRGLPQSITCDNAPTFLLTESILGQDLAEIKEDIKRGIADKEIRWNHITPYAPWQGGFYERLIKSIKHAIYKVLRGANRRSFDNICTFVIEVEACLNSRPLTYQGEIQETISSIRPIDFILRDITLTLPVREHATAEECDPDYSPPNGTRPLQYQRQVKEALHSSDQEAERFWNIWQQQYLLALRETHRAQLSNRRQGNEHPQIGDVVLVCDPVLPRNEWRMGRITELKHSHDGEVREAELLTSTKRKIRRPINLLIPLEIQEARISDDNEPTQVTPSPGKTGEEDVVNSKAYTRPYNLRQRTPKNYAQEVYTATMASTVQGIKPKWFLFHIMILSLIQVCSCRTTLCGSVGCANKEYFTVRQRYVAEASGVFDKCANEIGITQIAPRYFHSVMFDKALSFENEKPFQRYVACDDYAYPHIIDKNACLFQKDRGYNITHRILSTSSLLIYADFLIRWKLVRHSPGRSKIYIITSGSSSPTVHHSRTNNKLQIRI